ncbi:unnamed protein product [Caenorhabditis brenneri]
MFFRRLLSFFWKSRSERRNRNEAWPEVELFQMEKAKFTEVRTSYNGLVQELMESNNPRLNKLSMKYHSEAFEIIYVGTNRIYEHDELAVSY